MPAVVGNIRVNSLGSSAIFHVGDALILCPTSTSKSYAGSGSFNTGDFPVTNNAVNATNTNDPDIIDDSVKKVGIV